MKKIYLFAGLIVLFTAAYGQIVVNTPLSERVTAYTIDVELDPEAKTVSGIMNAYWVNISENIVPDIRLHMYLNAFRSNKSTSSTESGRSLGSHEIDFGWVDILSIHDGKGADMFESMKYIQPDDQNSNDMTVLQVMLNEAAMPGDTVKLNIEFISKLPSHLGRTGFSDDFFFVAQWFPKIGVYEPAGMRFATEGGWNCHQFHSSSEFYANHSVYDVSIIVPVEYVTGSGGMLISEDEIDDGKKRVVYRAEDIVDFAWTAWPDYLVAEDEWEHVKIKFLYPPGREDQVGRQLAAVKNALEYLGERVGPYPWPHLTFVDPPKKGAGSGGMEYTTIFTSGSVDKIPEFVLMPEMTTVHEFIHAYFMGIIASNEFEEPWLDEGMTSYWEVRIMDHYYGPGKGIINHENFGISDWSISRMVYVMSGDKKVVDNTPYSWDYPHWTYGMMSYKKAATWLRTLQGIIGEETIDKVFRRYYDEWGFDHPTRSDFVDITNEVVTEIYGDRFGEDMNWFFNQTLYGTGICDYKVDGISNSKIRSFKGIIKSDTGMVLQADLTDGDTIFHSVVRLQRLGEIMLPVELLVHFESGDEISEQWDGKATYKDFEYWGSDEILWATIDPDFKIAMDVNLINNSYTREPDNVPVKRFMRKFVTIMQFLILSVTL